MLLGILTLLFLAGCVTTAVALWAPEMEVTVFAGLANLFIWILVGFGLSNVQVVSNGAVQSFNHPGVSILAFANAILVSVVALTVGVYDNWKDTGQESING
jgi:hypothetical protein